MLCIYVLSLTVKKHSNMKLISSKASQVTKTEISYLKNTCKQLDLKSQFCFVLGRHTLLRENTVLCWKDIPCLTCSCIRSELCTVL